MKKPLIITTCLLVGFLVFYLIRNPFGIKFSIVDKNPTSEISTSTDPVQKKFTEPFSNLYTIKILFSGKEGDYKRVTVDQFELKDSELMKFFPKLDLKAVAQINNTEKEKARADFDEQVKNAADPAGSEYFMFESFIHTTNIMFATTSPILSFSRTINWDGGAHPSGALDSVNYNLETGKEITLESLFEGKVWQNKITDIVVQQIVSGSDSCGNCERLTEIMATANAEDKAELKSNAFISSETKFQIKNDGIDFLYSEYGLGSYVDTSHGQIIHVPFSSLKQFINPNGALKYVLTHKTL